MIIFVKTMTSIAILGWMYLNLHIFFPFILNFSAKYNSVIHIITTLISVGTLAQMNDRIGLEYRITWVEEYGTYELKTLANILIIPCLLLVGYSIIGAWFSFIDFGWEHLKLKWFNKIIFTIFCFSILSIQSRINSK